MIAVGGGQCYWISGCSGGCSFIGLFNIKNQSFVWAKYLAYKEQVRGIAFDGNYIVAAVQGHHFRGAVIKMDLSGNVIWARETAFSDGGYNSNYSIVPDVDGYVVLGARDINGRTWLVYKISLDGNSVNLIKGVWYRYYPYKMIRDNDGNYVITGSSVSWAGNCGLLTKINANGNILFSKRYCANNGSRIYDIAVDLDGNYLVSGTAIIGSNW